MTQSTNLDLTYLADNQVQAERLVNRLILAVDTLFAGGGQLTEATAPPGSPTDGTVRLVVATATGAFAGQEGKVAFYWQGGWFFAGIPLPSHWSTTEVRTGIWRDGKQVYQKVVDLSTGPNATTRNVAHGIGTLDLLKAITFECSANDGSSISLPGPVFFDPLSGVAFCLHIDATNIVWSSNTDMTGYTMKVRLRYCK